MLVLVAVLADWGVRTLEFKALLDAVEASESAMVKGNEAYNESLSDWNSENESYYRTRDSLEQRRQAFFQTARSAASDVRTTCFDVADVFVLPWHRQIRLARSAYGRHCDVWTDYFRYSASDADRAEQANSEISPSFGRAEREFMAAVPLLALFDADGRTEDIFDE